jgi:hypothetical protein
MQNKRDAHSEKQLPLEFDAMTSIPEGSNRVVSNVVRIQFGLQKTVPISGSAKDQELIERILQSAQKLKW